MNDNSTIRIAMAFDEAYVVHGATVIESIIRNLDRGCKLTLHIIDTGLSRKSRDRITSTFADRVQLVSFLTCPSGFLEQFPEVNHPRSAYARLALQDLLPELGKILYLDSDVVVLESIHSLFSEKLNGCAIGAVADAINFFQSKPTDYFESLGLDSSFSYFNSGVMLLDLEVWRRNNLLKEVVNWVQGNSAHLRYSDQSVLNALFSSQYQALSLRWNFQSPLATPVSYNWFVPDEIRDAYCCPGIIHFTTFRKPWKKEYRVFGSSHYWYYRKLLGWDVPSEWLTWRQLTNRFCEEIRFSKHCLLGKLRPNQIFLEK